MPSHISRKNPFSFLSPGIFSGAFSLCLLFWLTYPHGLPALEFGLIRLIALVSFALAGTLFLRERKQRERAEHAERSAELCLEMALHSGGLYAWEWDVRTDALKTSLHLKESAGAHTQNAGCTMAEGMVCIHPEDRAQVQDALDALVKDDIPFRVEYRLLDADGMAHWMVSNAEAERDAAGNAVRVYGIGRNVTAHKNAEHSLLQNQEFMQQISETVPDLLYVYSLEEQRNIFVNREIGAILGYTPAEIQELGSRLFPQLMHPDDLPYVIQQQARISLLPDGQAIDTEYRMQHRDGSWHWLLSRDTVFKRNADGQATQTLGIAQDITERKESVEKLAWQEALLRHTTEASELGFYVVDNHTTNILYANHKLLELWSITHLENDLQSGVYKTTDAIPICLPLVRDPDQFIKDSLPLQDPDYHETVEHEIALLNGRTLRRFSTPLVADQGEILGRLYLFEDISARKILEDQVEMQLVHIQDTNAQLEDQATLLSQANAQLKELATTDGLTGLRNNRAFRTFLEREFSLACRYQSPLSVILLDVDRFKMYNDTYGHPAGDEVLRGVARVLQDVARETDYVARYGGEEFVVVLPQTDREGAAVVAERMRAALEAYSWPCAPVTASFGVALRQPLHQNMEALISDADHALYDAKHTGRNRVACAPAADDVKSEPVAVG